MEIVATPVYPLLTTSEFEPMQNSSKIDFKAESPDMLRNLQGFLENMWQTPVRLSKLRRITAGLSWTTIGFTAQLENPGKTPQTQELILRIGDPGGVFAPYSAEPEYLALTSLFNVPSLPIPRAIAYSDDCAILGAPFIITEFVTGHTPIPWSGKEKDRDETEMLAVANDFVDALAAIHAFDWSHVPLAALYGDVPPSDIARHETRRWAKHAELTEGLAPLQMHYAMRWLETHAPVAEHVTVVHGDYRVGNFLQHEGRITAILDWELVHLGDPHEDLAWAGLRVFSPGKTRIGDLIEREAFYERYCRRTGFSIRPEVIRYYEVFGTFKIAATLVGAIHRIESGRARDVRMAAMGLQLAPTLLELNRLIKEAK